VSDPTGITALWLRERLLREQAISVPAAGVSMGPDWAAAGTLTVGRVGAGERLPRGAVLVYEGGSCLIAHRAVRRVAGGWITMGDGMVRPDRVVVPDAAVIGIVVAVGGSPDRVGRGAWWRVAVGWLGSWYWRPVNRLS
jgi:hypothetical protein